jgi:hypothetical protein
MASLADLSSAIAAAVTKEVSKTLKAVLSKVAEDYDLDFSELEGKYLLKESLKGKAKPKTAVKAKVTKKVEATSDDEEAPVKKSNACIAVTKKGEQCKCKARSGFTTCGRHKDFDPEAVDEPKPAPKKRGRPRKAAKSSDSDSEEEMAAPKKRGRKPKATAHEHSLEEAKSDCEECATQGGPFHLKEEAKEEFEVVDHDDIQKRINELVDEVEEEEEDEEEGEIAAEAGSEYVPSEKGDGESDFDQE